MKPFPSRNNWVLGTEQAFHQYQYTLFLSIPASKAGLQLPFSLTGMTTEIADSTVIATRNSCTIDSQDWMGGLTRASYVFILY